MVAGSTLLIDEFFESEDERFLEELLRSQSDQKLRSFAERWYADPRPFARRTLLAYIDDGCDRERHRGLVKTLFKAAEAKQDDEAMAHFLVAFDRLSKRELRKQHGWDYANRQPTEEWVLRFDKSYPARARRKSKRGEPEKTREGFIAYEPLPRFSRVTRQYLQRRAWRYFRKKARSGAAAYGKAIRAALPLYDEEQLSKPERLVDAWGLMHALYHGSPVLLRKPRGVSVAEGKTLAELQPAPFCPEAWKGCRDELLKLAAEAKGRTVRAFAIALLERDYAPELRGLSLELVRNLLASRHEEVQTFAVKLLVNAEGLESLPIKTWLSLLELENPLAVPILCELVEKKVSPDRLSLEQCVKLAKSRVAPVAELGLRWARAKKLASADDLRFLVQLANAEAPSVRAAAIDWVCQLLLVSDAAKPELLRDLLDSKYADVRERGLKLLADDARFRDDPSLWVALSESPYDDARAALIRSLHGRERAFAPESLHHLWATAILAVHRGSRSKQQAANQLAARVVRHPAEAAKLLPILGYALRSVRAPERRTALASLALAAHQRPALREAIATLLPELKLLGDEVAT